MAPAALSYVRDSLIERANALVPRLRERGEATSAARQIPAETIADFWDSGIWYLLKPKKFGGPEVRVDTVFEIASVLSRGDGSAGWVWTVMGVHDLFLSLFPEQAQQEYWAKDRTLSASSFAPSGKITPADGGFRLSGKWSFCSGIDHADWMLLAAMAGMISTNPPIPDIRFALVPIGQCRVIDDWHVMGLRGTGSKSVVVEDVFVPAHRVVANADLMAGTSPGASVASRARSTARRYGRSFRSASPRPRPASRAWRVRGLHRRDEGARRLASTIRRWRASPRSRCAWPRRPRSPTPRSCSIAARSPRRSTRSWRARRCRSSIACAAGATRAMRL